MRLALALWWVLMAGGAQGQDANWYESLKQPVTGLSCCSSSDCRVTKAEWRDGQWHARREDGSEVPIPPDIVLNEKAGQGPDGEAVLCAGTQRLYCFVPKDIGY